MRCDDELTFYCTCIILCLARASIAVSLSAVPLYNLEILGATGKQDLGARKDSSNTFLCKSPNFQAMPRKKVKAHKNIV